MGSNRQCNIGRNIPATADSGDAAVPKFRVDISIVRSFVVLDGNQGSENCLSDILSNSGHFRPLFVAL